MKRILERAKNVNKNRRSEFCAQQLCTVKASSDHKRGTQTHCISMGMYWNLPAPNEKERRNVLCKQNAHQNMFMVQKSTRKSFPSLLCAHKGETDYHTEFRQKGRMDIRLFDITKSNAR